MTQSNPPQSPLVRGGVRQPTLLETALGRRVGTGSAHLVLYGNRMMCAIDSFHIRRPHTTCLTLAIAGAALMLCGCSGISIAPRCPDEMRVGATGTVDGNVVNPGEIATYRWEVSPPTAGVFTDPDSPITSFQAQREGEAIIRLIASDGVFQVISECVTQITGTIDVAVALTVSEQTVTEGDTVTISCASVGESQTDNILIEQLQGTTVELTPISGESFTFVATEQGQLQFQCVGSVSGGIVSEPSVIEITVSAAPPDNVNDNVNDNVSVNDNTNDNTADDNTNDNTGGGRPPTRP